MRLKERDDRLPALDDNSKANIDLLEEQMEAEYKRQLEIKKKEESHRE